MPAPYVGSANLGHICYVGIGGRTGGIGRSRLWAFPTRRPKGPLEFRICRSSLTIESASGGVTRETPSALARCNLNSTKGIPTTWPDAPLHQHPRRTGARNETLAPLPLWVLQRIQFRARKSAAPLKQAWHGPLAHRGLQFRARKSAAPLKPF